MIDPLLKIMRQLRDPKTGCEWDKVQTFESIAPYTIEESYEVSDAIDRDDMDALKDELGDLLLQVVFHSQIATDEGHFEFGDVVESICLKMKRRHPHIFGNADKSPGWEEIKASERHEKGTNSALDGVAIALPALLRAQKIQKRAARVGFDWPDVKQVLEKVHEELGEVEEASTPESIQEEIGDLLFATVNLARHHNIDAENALKMATNKFESRFESVEEQAGNELTELPLKQLEEFWRRAKEKEKAS
ncbi:MAG: nucleoside triphosphate pyrophosphohydrolase [Parasphingorhabdus sp.]